MSRVLLILLCVISINGCCLLGIGDCDDDPCDDPNQINDCEVNIANSTIIVTENVSGENGTQITPDIISELKSSSAQITSRLLKLGSCHNLLGYGHVWSSEFATPTLENAQAKDYGTQANFNDAIKTIMNDLYPHTKYYARTWVTVAFKDDCNPFVKTLYNDEITEFMTPGSTVMSLKCNEASLQGDVIAGKDASNAVLSVPYTGGDGGAYNALNIIAAEIPNLSLRLDAGNFNSGEGLLKFYMKGTPSNSGQANFNINIGGASCIISISVKEGSVETLDCSSKAIYGNNLIIGVASDVILRIDYTGGNGGSFSSQSISSSDVTGLKAVLNEGLLNNNGYVEYKIVGTPSTFGLAKFTLGVGGKTCDISIIVYGSISDIVGNKYKTVKIGNQIWMAENLRTNVNSDGTYISSYILDNEWSNADKEGLCYHENDLSKWDELGLLYNGYVVQKNKVCPTGWHIPTNEEWSSLVKYLDNDALKGNVIESYIVAKKLKESRNWYFVPGVEMTNESGFTALPGGARYWDGVFTFGVGSNSTWWTSSSSGNSFKTRTLYSVDNRITTNDEGSKNNGFHIRCIKN